jgi:hypothetical protein
MKTVLSSVFAFSLCLFNLSFVLTVQTHGPNQSLALPQSGSIVESTSSHDHQQPSAKSTATKKGETKRPIQNERTYEGDTRTDKPHAEEANEDRKMQRQLTAYTGALVIVGLLQAIVMGLTLWMIRVQADIMRVHAAHLEGLEIAAENNAKAASDNAAAARAIAEATVKNIEIFITKERARIRIEGTELTLVSMAVRSGPFPRESAHIKFKIICHGSSTAFILNSYTNVWVSESAEVPSAYTFRDPMSLPKTVGPNIEIPHWVPIDPEMDSVLDQSATPGTQNRFFIHFRALIRYIDVFQTDTQWEMESRSVWNVTQHDSDDGGSLSWSKHSQEDTENEIEKAS